MKVLKPNKNRLTQGYSDSHKGYDHSGKGDQNYYSSFHGVVVMAKNSETKNWLINTKNDPYYTGKNRSKTTADYGNYIRIKANVDGKTVYQLGAHFQQGTVLPQGTEVKKGQVVAQIGNTGNSTGAHSHTEYRDENNQNFRIEFIDEVQEKEETKEEMEQLPKDNILRDFYRAAKTEYSDAEIDHWLQQNENLYNIFKSVLEGDGAVKERLLEHWKIDLGDSNMNYIELYKDYKDQIEDIKLTLGLSRADNIEELKNKILGLLENNQKLVKQLKPEIIYKVDGKDFETALRIGNLRLIIEKEVK